MRRIAQSAPFFTAESLPLHFINIIKINHTVIGSNHRMLAIPDIN